MNAINKTNTQVKENVQALDAAGKVTVTLFGGASLLIGIWSVACMGAALLNAGPVGLIKAYFSAVTGI
jgi:chitinase